MEQRWTRFQDERLSFWNDWIHGTGDMAQDRAFRLDKSRWLPDWAMECLESPPGETIRVLDLGSGPISSLAPKWDERYVSVIAADPLADKLNTMLDEAGIEHTPVIPTEGWDLIGRLPDSSFDLAYSSDFLEFTIDPLACIRQLIRVLKPGCWCVLFQKKVQVDREWVFFADQPWVFESDGQHVFLRNWKRIRHISDLVGGIAQVEVFDEGSYWQFRFRRRYTNERALPGRQACHLRTRDTFTAFEPRCPHHSLNAKALVSLHIPKTAGTSFRRILEQLYGPLLQYYYDHDFDKVADAPQLEIPAWVRALHGHFRVDVFASKVSNPCLITWFRDPVERALSSYHQIIRNIARAEDDRLVSKMKKREFSVIDFVRDDEYKEQLSWYLHGTPLNEFAFIGLTEEFNQSIHLFQYTFGLRFEFEDHRLNVNPAKRRKGAPAYYQVSDEVRELVRQELLEEISYYQRAREIFYTRLDDAGLS